MEMGVLSNYSIETIIHQTKLIMFLFQAPRFQSINISAARVSRLHHIKNRPLYKEIIKKLREKFHDKVNDSNITLATAPLFLGKALDDLDVPNCLRHRLSECNEW